MAVIVAEFANIIGDSQIAGFEDNVEVLAIRDTIEVSMAQGAGRPRSTRTAGKSRHSDIELTRIKDRASPKFAQACSSGQNLGEVRIHLFRTLEQGLAVYMTYTLFETYVTRIEQDTLDANNMAFQPHLVASRHTAPPSAWGLASVVGPMTRAQAIAVRLTPRSAVGGPRGIPGDQEIERLWLNAAKVSWTYTPYIGGKKGGAVQKGWNLIQGVEV
jgi:type VI secretion system Hcp family effector